MKGHKTQLKLFIWKEVAMSPDGHSQWSSRLRGYTRKLVYKPELRVDVPVIEINTKRKIMALVERFCGAGTWIVRGFSHGKNTKRVKQVRLAKVTVREHGEKFKSWIEDTWRLVRYWFFVDSDSSHLLRSQPRPDTSFDDSSVLAHKEYKGVGDG